MRRLLQRLALCLAALGILGWLALGAHRGWTQTRVAVKHLDEVTGIEGIEYRKTFVPGVDLLGATLLGAGLLAAVAYLIPSKPQTENRA